MSKKTLRDNTTKFCKDNSSLNVIKERYRNDAEPEAIYLTLFRLGPKREESKKPPICFSAVSSSKLQLAPKILVFSFNLFATLM